MTASSLIEIDEALAINIAWNSRDWRGQSLTPMDWEASNFQDVQTRDSAHEWWNFYIDHPANDAYVYGFFYYASPHTPNIGNGQKLAIFFTSHDPRTDRRYIVGAYLGAEYSEDGWPNAKRKKEPFENASTDGREYRESDINLRCPREQIWIVEPKRLLPLDSDRHLDTEQVGRSMTYLQEQHARRIMSDLVEARTARETSLMARFQMSD